LKQKRPGIAQTVNSKSKEPQAQGLNSEIRKTNVSMMGQKPKEHQAQRLDLKKMVILKHRGLI
jgi:hypothetical protein